MLWSFKVTQYVNAAAIDSWREIDEAIDGPLRDIMTQNGFAADVVDLWVAEMIQNSVDSYSEMSSPEMQPKRIRR